jgi:hypothetical protein
MNLHTRLPLPARARRFSFVITTAAVAATVVAITASALAGPAHADSKPIDPQNPATPTTVSADGLPTVQINGVVWTQTIVGNTVYAGGAFTTARPAGVAVGGAGTVTRSNILSYDITTGVLNTSFAPSFNGAVRTIVATSDHKHLYVGGAFTSVNGRGANHIAEIDATTGAQVTAFRASVTGTVYALALRADKNTLFVGGQFGSVDSKARSSLAAVAANIGILRSWYPEANGGSVQALAIAPDYSRIIVGGSFTTLNGSSNPGYGIGSINPATGVHQTWAMNSVIRDGGANSGITSLAGDSTGIYGAGFVFGSGGNLEGTFRADWKTGKITAMEDCHGDSYSVAVTSTVEYVAGHAHFCGNIGGFPQDGSDHYRGIAFGKTVTQKITTNSQSGYANFAGQPAPSLLDWFPNFNTGTVTGKSQGPWSVAANSQYVVYGGEFTTVNGIAQQGLVRFATPSIAPNKMGPEVTGTPLNPTVTSDYAGEATVSWTSDYDLDNANLTYEVYRYGTVAPVYTTTGASTPWNRPTLTYDDQGLNSGQTYLYRIKVIDPWGNTALSDNVSVTVK